MRVRMHNNSCWTLVVLHVRTSTITNRQPENWMMTSIWCVCQIFFSHSTVNALSDDDSSYYFKGSLVSLGIYLLKFSWIRDLTVALVFASVCLALFRCNRFTILIEANRDCMYEILQGHGL